MTEPTLLDAGFTERAEATIDLDAAMRMAACLDVDATVLDRGELPILWHWALFLPIVATADLGDDGHPRRRPEMAAFPQRMWVGSRTRLSHPLLVGRRAVRASEVVRADQKEGSSGGFWLLTVRHRVQQSGLLRVEEELDLVLRAPSALAAPGEDRDDPPEAEWVEEVVADPRLLFRFSAVTGNAHRIHYDHPYATAAEGYPDLVVHGPLTAILLSDLARRRADATVRAINVRAHAPLFANRRWWLTGGADDDGAGDGAALELAAIRGDHALAMTARVELDR